jgi:putative endonuclease
LTLLERNVRSRFGELDLIMRDGQALVFVEVRYRRGAAFGGGAGSVDPHKQARLVTTASRFLQAHRRLARLPCRFDVVAISGTAAPYRIEWLRDAFRPS